MIKLNSDTFRRAIEKAQTVRPACNLLHTDEINFTLSVARSATGIALVDIWFEGGAICTTCDCWAGTGYKRDGWPQPCYHVAAAALNLGLLTAPTMLPFGAAIESAPERAAGRQVPAPLLDPAEPAPVATPAESGATWLCSAVRALTPWWFAREARA